MDILKFTGILFLTCFLGLGSISGQDAKSLQNAFSKSYVAESQGDYSKASEALTAVFDKNSYVLNLRLGWLNYKAGLLTESESYYRRAIQLMPFGIEARFGLVYPLSSSGNPNQIINTYKEILEIDPHNSIANIRLGLVYYGLENYSKANIHFTKVVNLFPFDYDGLHMLAWTKLKMSKNNDAKVLFEKALLFKPKDQSALDGLALINQ